MSSFDDREKAQEAKFAHDESLNFKAQARRNKMLGIWAAGLMNHDDPAAYAKEVVAADFEEAGDNDVMRKVAGDLAAAGVEMSEAELRSQMDALLEMAREEVAAEG